MPLNAPITAHEIQLHRRGRGVGTTTWRIRALDHGQFTIAADAVRALQRAIDAGEDPAPFVPAGLVIMPLF